MSLKCLKYLEVKNQILKEIIKMEPHERIMSRPMLCKKYGVTRTTVDRAVSELVGEGYLYSQAGSGTYISSALHEIDKSCVDNNSSNDGVASWGVIFPNVMKDTYPGILRGIEDVAQEKNINVVVCNTDNDIEKQDQYIRRLIESEVQGIIIVPAISKNQDISAFKLLREKEIPFIFCNRAVDGITAPLVYSNDFYGGYIATKHLIKMGYCKIAYISSEVYKVSIDRYHGYFAAMAEARLNVDSRYVIMEEFNDGIERGYGNTMELLALDNIPDAIFCFNDTIASGAYKAIYEKEFKVSDDIGVIGYDNTSICEALPIKLTTISYETYEIGYKAAEVLQKIISGEDTSDMNFFLFQPKLIIRDSCKGKKQTIEK